MASGLLSLSAEGRKMTRSPTGEMDELETLAAEIASRIRLRTAAATGAERNDWRMVEGHAIALVEELVRLRRHAAEHDGNVA